MTKAKTKKEANTGDTKSKTVIPTKTVPKKKYTYKHDEGKGTVMGK